MAMTMTQKILAAHAGLAEVHPGQLIEAKLDLVLGNDITAPVAIKEFNKIGIKTVFDRKKIVLVPDHFTPNKDIKAAEQCKLMRNFADVHDIEHYFEIGKMGIEHALIPEQGLVTAGDCAIGADSHTCTYGALGAFSTGVGSTDMAAAMATGTAWFKVPGAIKVVLEGKPREWIGGKDLILHLIGLIGVDGALYESLEFSGPGVTALSIDDRLTVSNMAIEAGAKNGIFPVDEITLAYLKEHGAKQPVVYHPDPDATYERVVTINLSTLEPTVSFPHLPSNTKTVRQIGRASCRERVCAYV
jgi:3-isopropylmalate/(R)-2-methylmalate dehydratase large subunit